MSENAALQYDPSGICLPIPMQPPVKERIEMLQEEIVQLVKRTGCTCKGAKGCPVEQRSMNAECRDCRTFLTNRDDAHRLETNMNVMTGTFRFASLEISAVSGSSVDRSSVPKEL